MRKLLSTVGAVILTSSVTLAQDYTPYTQPKKAATRPAQDQQRPCDNDWKPVCARTRQNIIARYSNSCFAEQDSALVIGDESECIAAECSPVYEPVCARVAYARKGGDDTPIDLKKDKPPSDTIVVYANKAFFNACAAKELGKGATVLASFADGKYRYTESKTIKGAYEISSVCPTTCPAKVDLVCATDDQGTERLFPNRCSAVMQGALFKHVNLCAERR